LAEYSAIMFKQDKSWKITIFDTNGIEAANII
jgi:hypothetical protein